MKTAPAKFPGHPHEPKHAPRLQTPHIRININFNLMQIGFISLFVL